MTDEPNTKVLAALREQAASHGGACIRCGVLVTWFNHTGPQPEDCARCHANGRLFDRGCRGNCPRERTIDSGWRESGWPR